jgi:hypothetical protein
MGIKMMDEYQEQYQIGSIVVTLTGGVAYFIIPLGEKKIGYSIPEETFLNAIEAIYKRRDRKEKQSQ